MGVESREKPLCGGDGNSCPISLPCLFSLILFLPHMMLAPVLRLQQSDALPYACSSCSSLYLLCRHVAHDMGNRALDPNAPTQNPFTRHPYTTQYRHIPCSIFRIHDGCAYSFRNTCRCLSSRRHHHCDAYCAVYVPKEIFLAEVDARRNPLSDRVLGSARSLRVLKIPRILLF